MKNLFVLLLATISITTFGQINPTTLKATIDGNITNVAQGTVTRASIGGDMKLAVDYTTEQAAAVKTYVDNLLPYKSYAALISCTDSSTVNATLLTNNLGAVTWTRNAAGNYKIEGVNLFTVGKTLVLLTPNNGYYIGLTSSSNFSDDILFVETFNTTTAENINYIENIGVEIRVYN